MGRILNVYRHLCRHLSGGILLHPGPAVFIFHFYVECMVLAVADLSGVWVYRCFDTGSQVSNSFMGTAAAVICHYAGDWLAVSNRIAVS